MAAGIFDADDLAGARFHNSLRPARIEFVRLCRRAIGRLACPGEAAVHRMATRHRCRGWMLALAFARIETMPS
jgi:hypothetical protein